MSAPRLILADDHEILLDGLKSLLRTEFDIIATAANGVQVLELCRSLKPDLLVMDIGMPVLGGMEVVETLAHEETKIRVILLTMQGETELVVRAFRAGVAGYVMKHAASSELVTAIREVLAGRMFISPRIGRDLVTACLGTTAKPEREHLPAPFTSRQIEVLQLIALGKTMKEVAAALGISTRTAEAHKYQMMERHGVRSVPELLRIGMQLGVIDTRVFPLSGDSPTSRSTDLR